MPETYVKMPRTDYVAICDAVRAKNGESGAYVSGTVPTKISALDTVNDVEIIDSGDSTHVTGA